MRVASILKLFHSLNTRIGKVEKQLLEVPETVFDFDDGILMLKSMAIAVPLVEQHAFSPDTKGTAYFYDEAPQCDYIKIDASGNLHFINEELVVTEVTREGKPLPKPKTK